MYQFYQILKNKGIHFSHILIIMMEIIICVRKKRLRKRIKIFLLIFFTTPPINLPKFNFFLLRVVLLRKIGIRIRIGGILIRNLRLLPKIGSFFAL